MQLASIPKFLLGDRQAIQDIASSKNGLIVGALLVLSAGFAREYDAEYLVKEPWHLLIPLAASLLISILFFALVYGIGKRRGIGNVGLIKAFRSFLVLFWMTAPLAWIYAIPFERFCDPIGAVHANLWLLRIVSLWRIVLMTRVVSVFFGCGLGSAFFCVMPVADIAMMAALEFAPLPTLQLMGGIRLSDTASIIANTAFTIWFLGFLSLPIWLIGVLITVSRKKPVWKVIDLTPSTKPSGALILFATLTVLVWFVALPWTQPEQRLRYETESLLTNGQVSEGLAVMSQHQPTDYPPLWDPPPRPDFRVYKPDLPDVMLAMLDEPPSAWVKTIYDDKFGRWLQNSRRFPNRGWAHVEAHELEKILSILERIPDGSHYATQMISGVEKARYRLGHELVDRTKKLADKN